MAFINVLAMLWLLSLPCSDIYICHVVIAIFAMHDVIIVFGIFGALTGLLATSSLPAPSLQLSIVNTT